VKRKLLLASILTALFIGLFVLVLLSNNSNLQAIVNRDIWPTLPNPNSYLDFVANGLASYKEKKVNYRHRLQTYSPFNDYLQYGTTRSYKPGNFEFDSEGLPRKKYSNGYHYNPVIMAEFALTHYGKFQNNQDEPDLNLFYTAANKLISMQDNLGALRYQFVWDYYLTGETYQEGWVSGMAQGQALSVYARAYHLTKDTKYLDAGENALNFMLTPVKKGGTLSTLEDLHVTLKDYIFIEEYLADPFSYTLNGYMFSLLGLYDWWQVSPDETEGSHAKAKEYFDKGTETLVNILPYYDIGGFSVYDLGYITHKADPLINSYYHAVHIYLLHALASITQNPTLAQTEKLWASYVDQ
jgi:heparosan-N-sulfate-glucuronate 5-epimerase